MADFRLSGIRQVVKMRLDKDKAGQKTSGKRCVDALLHLSPSAG